MYFLQFLTWKTIFFVYATGNFIYLPIRDEFERTLNREDGCEDVVKISQGL